MVYSRLRLEAMSATGRYDSVKLLTLVIIGLSIVLRCNCGLQTIHVTRRCWSDVQNPVTNLNEQNTTCFSKNTNEAICYKIKKYTIQECEPPWKLVAFKDPMAIDHLAMTLFNGTDLNIGLNIVTSEKVFRNFNLLTENNDCTAFKPFNNASSDNLCAFVIARTNTDYYEVHFHNTSTDCSEHFSTYYYACSKTVTIANASQGSTSSPTNETIIPPTSIVSPTAGIEMLIIVIIAAGAINVLIILIITTCCCYYKQKYHKKSLLISGSMKYTNRSLPTPVTEATYKPTLSECSEYAYPTLPTFQSRPSNKQSEQDESSAYMLSNAPVARMDEDVEYMGLGETVNEHRQKSILAVKRRKHQRQNHNVSSYLEVEDVSETESNNLNPQGPIAHTYADLDSTTQCNGHEVDATTHHTTNQKQESNCYMDLDDAGRTPNRHMDVSVYKDLHGHMIPSGCNRKGCQECKSARMNQTPTHSSFNHDNTRKKSTESPLYQEVEPPVFYMAVEGKSEASCEIGQMAKCFDDNTYSFLT